MPDNLTSGTFKIVSLIESNPPVGVGPPYIGLQFVHLNGVDIAWRIVKDGEDTYRLAIDGYRSTLTTNDKVAASIEPGHDVEWIATYRRNQDAYTIEPVNGAGRGWTVPFDADPDSNAAIRVEPIIIEPVKFSRLQLFKFVPVHE